MIRQIHFVPPVPTVLAKQLGLLAGVDLLEIRTTGSEEQLRRLASHEVDIAVTAIDNLYQWSQRCPDLMLVGQVEETTPLCLYGARNAESLNGSSFAVDALDNGFSLVARHLLPQLGAHEVQLVVVGGVRERLEALLSGAVDATLLGPPFSQMAERAGLTCLARTVDHYPDYPGQGLVVRRDVLDASEIQSYLGALAEAVRRSASMSAQEGESALEEAGFARGAPEAWRWKANSLKVSRRGLDTLRRIRRDLDELPESVNISQLVDREHIEPVVGEV